MSEGKIVLYGSFPGCAFSGDGGPRKVDKGGGGVKGGIERNNLAEGTKIHECSALNLNEVSVFISETGKKK